MKLKTVIDELCYGQEYIVKVEIFDVLCPRDRYNTMFQPVWQNVQGEIYNLIENSARPITFEQMCLDNLVIEI